ncbi:MAG: hypothetical protein GX033_02415, partial [Firmicutes bacterium]|nr:hypothetical protein [Bacillota bacterium]
MNWHKKWRKYSAVTLTAAQSRLAYRQEMGARTFFFATILFTFSGLWGRMIGADSTVAGYSQQQLVWYLTLTEAITLSATSLLQEVEQDVKTGQIGYLLAKPLNYLLYQAAYYTGEMAVAFSLNLLAGGLVAWALVGLPPITPSSLIQTLVLVALGAAVRFCLLAAIALLSFFVEECRPFYWIYSKLIFTMGGLFIPIDLYPQIFRRLAALLPFQSITYGPARAFISGDWQQFISLANLALFWCLILAALLYWEFSRGVK